MVNEFHYRLNKLYTHPLLGDLLDSGDIDYAILDALEGFMKIKNYMLTIDSEYAIQEFMKCNIIRAMLDLNILFKSKYYNHMNVEHYMYHDIIAKYVKEKKE